MTVLIAPQVSTVKGIITRIPPDHVHPAFIAPRDLELTCPNPQDFLCPVGHFCPGQTAEPMECDAGLLTPYLRNENNFKFKRFFKVFFTRLNFQTRFGTTFWSYSQLPVTRTFKGNCLRFELSGVEKK